MAIRRGILWDMDGVLVDTGEAHYQSWLAILSERDIEFTREFFRQSFGMNNTGVLKKLLGADIAPKLIEELSNRKEDVFLQLVKGRVEPLPGVVGWLSRLKNEGYRMGVASSAPPTNIDALIEGLGIGHFFDVLVSGVDMAGKPDPGLFLEVARRMDVPPEACVVVEDAIPGVEAAKRAGMACIAVTTTSPADALAAADVIVDRLDRLPEDIFGRLLDGTGS